MLVSSAFPASAFTKAEECGSNQFARPEAEAEQLTYTIFKNTINVRCNKSDQNYHIRIFNCLNSCPETDVNDFSKITPLETIALFTFFRSIT